MKGSKEQVAEQPVTMAVSIKNMLAKLKNRGFFHIFGSSIINKIVQFASGIFLVRLLAKTDYGAYVYAQNWLNIIMLLTGLGSSYALMQFGSESTNLRERNGYFSYALKIGLFFNLLLCGAVVLISQHLGVSPQQNRLLFFMFLMPLFLYLFDYVQIYFRTNLRNIEFSWLSSTNTIAIFLFSVIGAVLYQAMGVIAGTYLAYIVSLAVGALLLEYSGLDTKDETSVADKKGFFVYALQSMVNNGISQTVYLIDIFLLGLLISDPGLLATYKAATLIPFALNFIPSAVMTFVYPYVAKHQDDKRWVRDHQRKLQKYLLLMNAVIVGVSILFAPLILRILFGSQYEDAAVYFRILMLGYFLAGTFRSPAGNMLAMLKQVKILIVINSVMGALNLIMDWVMIRRFGALGAAWTTCSVIALTALLYHVFLSSATRGPGRQTAGRTGPA